MFKNDLRLCQFFRRKAFSARELSGLIGISQRKIEGNIAKLKAMGMLERIGSPKKGEWRING